MPDSVSVKVETNLAAVMRDGTTLYADVYRPDGPGPFPTILQRTPYDKSSPLAAQMLDPIKAAKVGFALAIQDTRGRYTSGGEFYCFVDDINDGYDTVKWAAAQPWRGGKELPHLKGGLADYFYDWLERPGFDDYAPDADGLYRQMELFAERVMPRFQG